MNQQREEMTMAVTTGRELDEEADALGDQTTADTEESDTEPESTESESAESEDTEPEGAESDEVVDQRPRWRGRVLAGIVAVLLLGSLATSGYLGWQLWQDRQVARAGEDARAAAVEYAQILTSIDSGKVDENFDQVLDGATGEFKDMYSQSSMQLRQLLIDNKASAHGVVVESAIQSASKDTAVVLLFVDQSVSNSAVPDPRIDRSRIKMTMQHVDDRWRASKVELP